MPGKRTLFGGVAALAAAALLASIWRLGPAPESAPITEPLPAVILNISADKQFARIEQPGRFAFPADHAGHPDYRTEWWYLMGTLDTGAERPLAVQWLVLRIALAPEEPDHASGWATSNIYAGLLSITDAGSGRVSTDERVSRAALELAGANTDPVRLWIEDWRLEQTGLDGDALEFRIRVATSELELELELANALPLIDGRRLTEEGGGAEVPFRFYIQPRMTASGTLRTSTGESPVTGTFSLEHAWGELPLPGGPVARDRFTLYLADGRVLLAARTHRSDGSGTPATTGLLLSPEGRSTVISGSDIRLAPARHWRSPRTDARYPIRWTLRVPEQGIDVVLEPYWQDQEGIAWLPFWAGPVRVTQGTPRGGEGIVMLSGYQGS